PPVRRRPPSVRADPPRPQRPAGALRRVLHRARLPRARLARRPSGARAQRPRRDQPVLRRRRPAHRHGRLRYPATLAVAHPPMLAAVERGSGRPRPGRGLAAEWGVEAVGVAGPPLSDPDEQKLWLRGRQFSESVSRLSQTPGVGPPLRQLLETITSIPH